MSRDPVDRMEILLLDDNLAKGWDGQKNHYECRWCGLAKHGC